MWLPDIIRMQIPLPPRRLMQWGTHAILRVISIYHHLLELHAYPAPNSPKYYPYSNSHINGPQQKEPMASPHSPYQSSSSARPDMQFSGLPTRSQPLLPFPESSHPSLLRRGSFPSEFHQSESNHYPQRPALLRTGSSPATKRRHH